jgi:hypothetical protein
MLEGSRAFDIAWGTITALLCFSLGLPALVHFIKVRRGAAPLFGTAVDPGGKLQFAWGLFAMGMGGTNLGCRYIDHRYLEGVHEGFFGLTLIVVAVMLPLLAVHAYRRRASVATRARATVNV